jgi:prevent-host-death family protein
MAKEIAQRELRNHNAEIVAAVTRGESFIVTRRGIPVAELRPFGAARRRFVPKGELRKLTLGGPPVDPVAFRQDLDSLADQSLT